MEQKTTRYIDYVKEKTAEINEVSPTFCLAKWVQSTVLLYNGSTHSCHHPERHKIKAEDISVNHHGLHNTPVKMKARKEMLEGKQTAECDYCWNIENLGKNHTSDRIYKSLFSWSYPRFQEVLDSGLGEKFIPSYLEIAFDTACNLKCVYCNPESSSSWESEINKFGAVPQVPTALYDLGYLKRTGGLPIPQEAHNPYIEAFWKWWPELYQKVRVLRVTGGEPLMSPHTWRLMDRLQEGSREDFNFSINTNLCVPDHMIERLITKINSMSSRLEAFDVYTSLESVGAQAEYTRFGMNYEKFRHNCDHLLASTPEKTRLTFMTTIGILSAPSFTGFLEFIAELRSRYRLGDGKFRINTSFNYLRWPHCLSLGLLPPELKKKYGSEWISLVEKSPAFYAEEVDQIKRLVDFMNAANPPMKDYENFRLYMKAMDERRNLNFLETFPELALLIDDNYFNL